MTVTMQTRILDRLEEIIKYDGGWQLEQGLLPVRQPNFANTGMLYAQTPDFTSLWTCGYDFQASYCTLKFTGPAITAADLTDNPPVYRYQQDELAYHHLNYDDGPGLRALFTLLTRITVTAARAHRKAS